MLKAEIKTPVKKNTGQKISTNDLAALASFGKIKIGYILFKSQISKP